MESTTTKEDVDADDIIRMTHAVQIPSAIALSALILIGIGGNILTIMAHFKDRRTQKVYDFIILNLAITDLLLCFISMPFYAVYTLTEFTWPFGYSFCKVWLVSDFTLCFETILLMLILSLDRLLMITVGPYYLQNFTQNMARATIVISWIVSFLVYGPAIIGWNHWVGYSTVEYMDCDVEFAYNHSYTTVTAVLEFILPFVCLTSLNVIIYCKIKRRLKIIPTENENSQPKQSTSESINGTAEKYKFGDIKRRTSRSGSRSHAKAAKFLAILVMAFLVFWAPYTITTMAISFCDQCVNTSLYEFFNWLLWMKSAVNPFLYAFNSPKYRTFMLRYLTLNGLLCKYTNGDTPHQTTTTSAQ